MPVLSLFDPYGNVLDAISTPENAQCYRCRVRIGIGKKEHKVAGDVGFDGPKAGCQILYENLVT
jgi:hypothetical protein